MRVLKAIFRFFTSVYFTFRDSFVAEPDPSQPGDTP